MRQKLICSFLILMFSIVSLPNTNAQTTAGEKKTTTKKPITTSKKTTTPTKKLPSKKQSSKSSSNKTTTTNVDAAANKNTATVSNSEQEALIQQAKTKLELAQRELERVQKLYSASVISSTELKEAEARVKLADQELKAITNEATNKQFRNLYGIEMVYIPPGEFMMGSNDDEIQHIIEDTKRYVSSVNANDFENEKPKHRVAIKKGFYMGKFEVTQTQWRDVMGTEPSYFSDCDNCPVEQVSWNDAKEFIKKLNALNDGYVYRLPSEAEWEYACRAGTTTFFSFGNSLSSLQANFIGDYPFGDEGKGKSLRKTTPVGSYQPNDFGLYDMHGNVWEWCEDIYAEDYESLPTDGSANLSKGYSNLRVLRGGSWFTMGVVLGSAIRRKDKISVRDPSDGFRVVAFSRAQ